MTTEPDNQSVSSDRPPGISNNKQAEQSQSSSQNVRRRPPVNTQPKDVQERCIRRGEIFYELEQMKIANGGKLPRGILKWALSELDMSKARLTKLWNTYYEPYRRAFPDADPAEAFSPYSATGGRPCGRDIPPEVTRAIQQLCKERGFDALNYDGTVNKSRLPVLAKGILSGVKTLFPENADDIRLYDVYAAINDLMKKNAANVHLAHGNDSIIEANLPSRNSDIEGSDEQWQIDIRPLPGYVRYNDTTCTVLAVVIADRMSSKIWAGRLIPGVKVKNGEETNEDVWSGDYKAQEIRDLIALAIWRAKHCFRMLYPDNGSHFRKVVLGPYMPYLASSNKDGTQIIRPILVNRTPLVPRGGGFIENLLGNLDRWMRKFYGHQDERIENFRVFYRKVNKEIAKLPTLETVAKDFQGHIGYLNKEHREEEGDLTREERWKQGPDKSLPMPPLLNLALFAKQVKTDSRKVHDYGFDYASKKWEFERDDKEFRAQWLNAALSSEKRAIIIMKIGRETLVFMNVSGDGRIYERAIPKGKPRNTIKQDKALNSDARRILEEENRADSEALDNLIRKNLNGGQLVIHPSGTKLIDRSAFVNGVQDTPAPASADSNDTIGTQNTPDQTLEHDESNDTQVLSDNETRTSETKKKPEQKKTRKKATKRNQKSNPEPQIDNADEQYQSEDDEEDLWADFSGF